MAGRSCPLVVGALCDGCSLDRSEQVLEAAKDSWRFGLFVAGAGWSFRKLDVTHEIQADVRDEAAYSANNTTAPIRHGQHKGANARARGHFDIACQVLR
jgi:hypothetical protein